jgi:hypothetical protein
LVLAGPCVCFLRPPYTSPDLPTRPPPPSALPPPSAALQDELFNLTTDNLRATAISTSLELQVEGALRKVQLDNQMLDAVQPVVLAPAVEYRPQGAVASSAKEPPLISFSFIRSYAGSGEKKAGAGQAGSCEMASDAGSVSGVEAEKQSIKSFKDIRLDIGEAAVEWWVGVPGCWGWAGVCSVLPVRAWCVSRQGFLACKHAQSCSSKPPNCSCHVCLLLCCRPYGPPDR